MEKLGFEIKDPLNSLLGDWRCPPAESSTVSRKEDRREKKTKEKEKGRGEVGSGVVGTVRGKGESG